MQLPSSLLRSRALGSRSSLSSIVCPRRSSLLLLLPSSPLLPSSFSHRSHSTSISHRDQAPSLCRPLATSISTINQSRRHSSQSSSAPPSGSSSTSSSYLPSPSQIHVVPFSIPPKEAFEQILAVASLPPRDSPAFKEMFDDPPRPPPQKDGAGLLESKMIYLPGWAVQAKLTTTFTFKEDEWEDLEDDQVRTEVEVESERRMREKRLEDEKIPKEIELSLNRSFMNGTSSYPLSQLSLQPTLNRLPKDLPIYDPSRHLKQYGHSITALPFDTSPLALPSLLKGAFPIAYSGSYGSRTTYTITQLKYRRFNVTPLYLPFYVVKVEYEGKEQTFMLEATKAGQCEVYMPHPEDKEITFPSKPYYLASDHIGPWAIPFTGFGGVPLPITPKYRQPRLVRWDRIPPPEEETRGPKKRGREKLEAWLEEQDFKRDAMQEIELVMDKREVRETLRRRSLRPRQEGKGGKIVSWEEMVKKGVVEQEEI